MGLRKLVIDLIEKRNDSWLQEVVDFERKKYFIISEGWYSDCYSDVKDEWEWQKRNKWIKDESLYQYAHRKVREYADKEAEKLGFKTHLVHFSCHPKTKDNVNNVTVEVYGN